MEKLKKVLHQEDTVLFIGSGISMWSGLPSWSGLVEDLAKFLESEGVNADIVRAEAGRGDLLQAASYGFDKLTNHQIGDFIRAACRYGHAKPEEIHRKIVFLGPRCYVTTNYDNLLEEALRKWRPDLFFPPAITNRHLTATAEIIHSHAKDFIFKPHGDAADSDSIILTREQYRQMLPQGERHHALESLKTLLVSRPFVYLGFGLRDPDFLHVRDLLANTYRGGTRDHFAIMADVTDTECDYWRRNYGIHLVSYPTKPNPDGRKDHAALLAILDRLLEPAPGISSTTLAATAMAACTPELVLSLARHAARVERVPKVRPEFKIRVHAESNPAHESGCYYRLDPFDHRPVDRFLEVGPERAILVGLPGAGKTYALRQVAARLAERLHEICLAEPFLEASVVIPIYVDLKLYCGNLAELVDQALPPSLPFREITKRFRSKVFLDSFNEIPREYWESGSYERDFAKFSESATGMSLIIGSRTNDGLTKLGLPTYCLDQIDEREVSVELARMGIDLGGRFDQEVRMMLQKPFYFQLLASGAVSLPTEAHPRDLYNSYFENLECAFLARFGKAFKLEEPLSITAYDAINRGEEAFPLADLLRVLKVNVEASDLANVSAGDVANWLVSTSVLIPHRGGRVAFVHQSITEYLASKELAKRYQTTPRILKEKLALTRWDQALFLSLSQLSPLQAEAFFSDVARADFTLSLSAVKYLEDGRDEVISKLLTLVPQHYEQLGPYNSRIEGLVESSLPLSEVHEPQLRALMKCRDSIGAAAVARLVAMKGPGIKDELLQEMVEARSDYNFCTNGIGRVLAPFANPEDVMKVVALADSIRNKATPNSEDESTHGFTSGAARFLSELDIRALRDGFWSLHDSENIPEIHARILCDILQDHRSTEALDFAGELLLRGVNAAATTLYFISNFSVPANRLSWNAFTPEHQDRLMTMAEDPMEGSWALKALQCLCKGRPDLAEAIRIRAAERTGIAKASLLHCAAPADAAPILEALNELARMDPEQRAKEPIHLLDQIEINWAGNEVLFVQLLGLRDTKLALAILEQVYQEEPCTLGLLEIGPIEGWLDWLMDEPKSEREYFLLDRISWLFANFLSQEKRHAFVKEFNKPTSNYRALLSRLILLHQHELSTDEFSPDAVSFLLADLASREFPGAWHGELLGQTATESFVYERLLPLVEGAGEPLLGNLRAVLRQAGSRHGRRYLFD